MPQLENWTDEERELLQSAELDAPAPAAQSRTLAALGISGAALSSSVAVAGSAKAASLATTAPSAAIATTLAGGGKALLVGKLLTIVVASGIVGGAVLHYRSTTNTPPMVAARPNQPAKAGRVAAVTDAPVVAAASNTAVAPEAAPSVTKPTVAPPRAEPDITLEIEALDRARSAEGRGAFATALAELDQYDRSFKHGRLRPEALVLRVQTLLDKGDAAGAKALGGRFLARYPKSPLAPRIQKLIGAAK